MSRESSPLTGEWCGASVGDDRFGHHLALGERQQNTFSCAATDIKPTHSGLYEVIEQTTSYLNIDSILIRYKRRHQRWPDACQTIHTHPPFYGFVVLFY